MSCSEKKDAPFAYESSVHNANVLLRLNSHRENGLLCDVTIIVEDQRFRAHRTVLAASSDYFLSRVVQAYDGDFTITLPEEVTVKGFLPLLQFAYTSKLLVTRDSLSEIRKCAKLLEIHDVEETCFEFLKLQFQENKAKPADPRKKCCKSFCPKAAGQQNESGRPLVHEVEELWRGEFSQNLKCPVEIENASPSPESPKQPCESFCLGRDSSSGYSSLCPKYRKFQKACKNGRVRSVSTCSSNQDAQSPSPAPSSDASEPVSQPKPQVEEIYADKSDMEVNLVPPQGPVNTYQNLTCVDDKVVMTAAYPPCFPLGHQDFNSVPFSAYQPYRNLNYPDTPNDSSTAGLPEGSNSRQSNLQAAEILTSDLAAEPQLCASGKPPLIRERSNVEREVAEHLAKGFWSDVYPTEYPCQQELEMVTSKESALENNMEKRTECPWLGISISNERTFVELNPVSCPFISNLTNNACANSPQPSSEDGAMSKTQENCPYACSINLEEDTESDSEEDSIESSSAIEQECEKTLPFSAQKIISLSRYDFQSLVKTHTLSTEQLDCIHDIRRRSKNRIAAQRCRKRKLDCIQNLETEIMKLQNEREHLLKERDQILSTLGETKQNLTGLCQKVCREAALSREQIHILAKYSSTECPLSFLVPEKGKMVLQREAMLQDFAGGLTNTGEASRRPAEECNSVLQNAASMAVKPPATALPRQSATAGGIADFCQQMTAKCTTDEQN